MEMVISFVQQKSECGVWNCECREPGRARPMPDGDKLVRNRDPRSINILCSPGGGLRRVVMSMEVGVLE